MARYFGVKRYDDQTGLLTDRHMLVRLWGFARPFRMKLFFVLLIMLAAAGVELLRPYLMKLTIDVLVAAGDVAGLGRITVIYGLSVLLSGVLSYWQAIQLQYIGQQIIHQVRRQVFRHILFQPYRELEGQPVGRLVTRVTNDTDAVKDLYTDVLVALASDFFMLAGIIAVMLAIHWQLALVSFTVLPVMILVAALYQKYARRAFRLVREKTAGLNTYVQESLNGILTVKAFARFDRSEGEFRSVSDEYLAAGLQEMRTYAIFRPLVDFIYVMAVLLLLWYSDATSRIGGLEIGIVAAFLRYVEKFFWPIKDLAEKYNLLQSALAAAERLYDLLAASGQSEEPETKMVDRHFAGKIIFDNVWFAYQEPDWVLQGVTFEIQPGQFIGVAGLSGSGKTTLIALLLRFYEPQQGRILLDDIDIRQIPPAILRRRIGVVFQDVHLFPGTVAENISMFDPAVPGALVQDAARTANLSAFIQAMPDGYDTPVGYQGAWLSVGQRQLLSLARVLAVQADVLVLDEATSNIDSETEGLIQQALENASAKRTTLVVAHRLSTVQTADRIIVLSRGQLVEAGTHEELLALRGVYHHLYISQ
ncbi:ABC transporter ATP-binding protein [Acetonema longum]|uniref:ABC-type multidrug/protein/lipid transport system, ATPase component n=1 Tax=Acetonema longum DSM 6540 TaxID=1009370 RepID=F7NNI3_9FIRM|nr:ABC transporter ATP-binding protein [Acetonema longum]EGO62424.1 ABC-type multidrug/protein/lipid transport system, ATPase component [Acetonema longum DSM 6540]